MKHQAAPKPVIKSFSVTSVLAVSRFKSFSNQPFHWNCNMDRLSGTEANSALWVSSLHITNLIDPPVLFQHIHSYGILGLTNGIPHAHSQMPQWSIQLSWLYLLQHVLSQKQHILHERVLGLLGLFLSDDGNVDITWHGHMMHTAVKRSSNDSMTSLTADCR